MKKVLLFVLTVVLVIFILPLSQVGAKTNNGRTFILPPYSEDASIIYLGQSYDRQSNQEVEGYAFIYRDKNNSARSSKPVSCYGYLAKGAKWKNVESWLVNTDNSRGLGSSFVFDNMTSDISKWEDAANGIIDDSAGFNILGDGSTTNETLVSDTLSPDNENEVYFADIAESGVIGVTTIWGVFGGPINSRQLVEWDMVFDDVDFDWSSFGESSKMDFENIATHELGHAVGMGDLYANSCNLETMFGYASDGETIKRDLNTGDITGINLLY